jgi:hypothetical protein
MHCQHEYCQWQSTADRHEYLSAGAGVQARRRFVGDHDTCDHAGGEPDREDPPPETKQLPIYRIPGLHTGFPVFQYSPHRTHKKIDNPTVIDGKLILNNTVMANCHRERSSRLNAASRNTCGP